MAQARTIPGSGCGWQSISKQQGIWETLLGTGWGVAGKKEKGEFAISILAEGRSWPLPHSPSSFPVPENLLEKEKMIIMS